MTVSPTPVASGHHLPRPTVRLRLTLVYGALFAACGAALLVFVYLLSRSSRFIAIRDPIYFHGRLTRIAPLLSQLRADPAQFKAVVSRLQAHGARSRGQLSRSRAPISTSGSRSKAPTTS
jgi:hypothetical protein